MQKSIGKSGWVYDVEPLATPWQLYNCHSQDTAYYPNQAEAEEAGKHLWSEPGTRAAYQVAFVGKWRWDFGLRGQVAPHEAFRMYTQRL